MGDDSSGNGRDGANGRSRFHLDGVREEDYPALLRWMNDLDELPLWTVRRKPMLPADLVQHIENRTRSAFFVVIRHSASGEAVGFVDTTIRERHEVAEFECYIGPEWRAHGAGPSIGIALGHLFANWPIRKLYCQTFAYNTAAVEMLRRLAFEEVGRFREFVWREDRYWDLIVFCFSRADFERSMNGHERLDRVRRRLLRSGRLA